VFFHCTLLADVESRELLEELLEEGGRAVDIESEWAWVPVLLGLLWMLAEPVVLAGCATHWTTCGQTAPAPGIVRPCPLLLLLLTMYCRRFAATSDAAPWALPAFVLPPPTCAEGGLPESAKALPGAEVDDGLLWVTTPTPSAGSRSSWDSGLSSCSHGPVGL